MPQHTSRKTAQIFPLTPETRCTARPADWQAELFLQARLQTAAHPLLPSPMYARGSLTALRYPHTGQSALRSAAET